MKEMMNGLTYYSNNSTPTMVIEFRLPPRYLRFGECLNSLGYRFEALEAIVCASFWVRLQPVLECPLARVAAAEED
jgi:hypothetical protein